MPPRNSQPENAAPPADAPSPDAAKLAADAERDRRAADEAAAAAAADRAAADDAAKTAAADRAAAEEMLALADRDRAIAADLAASVAAPAPGAPLSAQLEPFTAPRPAREDTVVRERVTVRRSAALASGLPGPRFNARAIALPGGRTVSAVPPEHADGERVTVRIIDRVLHDGVLYEPGSVAEVTRAQFQALRYAGAAEA